jgi:hypothetical protein
MLIILGYRAVNVSHRASDRAVSVHLAEEVAQRLPNCQPHFIDNEGHYSLPIRHVREILGDLLNCDENI